MSQGYVPGPERGPMFARGVQIHLGLHSQVDYSATSRPIAPLLWTVRSPRVFAPHNRCMNVLTRVMELRGLLESRTALQMRLGSAAKLRTAISQGRWVRVGRGWYFDAAKWNALSVVDRHLALALCTDRSARTSPVFSHVTAALLYGIPILRLDDRRVHVVQEPPCAGSTTSVSIHRGLIAPRDRWAAAGLTCTSPTRTLVDIARSMPFETGLVAVERALYLARTGRRPVWGSTADALLLALHEELARLPSASGCARARRVLDFASTLSESPLESLNRLQLERLGFTVLQQVSVTGSAGQRYRLDAELEHYQTFVEADGRQKYLDEEMRGSRSLDEYLLQEKLREDDVRGVTRKGVVRVMWEHVQSPEALARRLRAFQIDPPGASGKRLLELM